MDEIEILIGNKLIAEIIGFEELGKESGLLEPDKVVNMINPDNEKKEYVSLASLKYHSSWDWFVPAFNKIQKMKHDKEFCDLILAYVRHDDHINAFKCLINYIYDVVCGQPLKSNMEELKELKKIHLK